MARPVDIKSKNLSYNSIDDKDVIRFIELVRTGFSFNVFSTMVRNTPFSLKEWSSFLNMSERTMLRHKQEKRGFEPIHSERILHIALLYNLGSEIFGNNEKFDTWLETQNLALGGIRPKELLDNSFGIGLLKDELTRIEHGVLA